MRASSYASATRARQPAAAARRRPEACTSQAMSPMAKAAAQTPITVQTAGEIDPPPAGLGVLVAGVAAALAEVCGADAVVVTVTDGAVVVTVTDGEAGAVVGGVVGAPVLLAVTLLTAAVIWLAADEHPAARHPRTIMVAARTSARGARPAAGCAAAMRRPLWRSAPGLQAAWRPAGQEHITPGGRGAAVQPRPAWMSPGNRDRRAAMSRSRLLPARKRAGAGPCVQKAAEPVLAQAAGLAFLAALSPTALLVGAIYLGSSRPRLTASFYLAGAILMSLAMGIIVLVALRSGHLERPGNRTPRYGLRLGLGALLLAAAAWLARRRRKPPDPAGATPRIVTRLVASPAPGTAVVAGLVIFSPGVTFVAAVQVVATARVGWALSVIGLILVVLINACLVWLPLVAYLAAPGVTTRLLARFNAWLQANARTLLAVVLLLAGLILTVDGVSGLAG